MNQPVPIQELVERFALHHDAYKSGQYNETQVRREFLDPFFKALGWDMDNTAGKSEAYQDVFHEDKIRVAGVLKAPDYSFRLIYDLYGLTAGVISIVEGKAGN